jgi:HEAT repeat protein
MQPLRVFNKLNYTDTNREVEMHLFVCKCVLLCLSLSLLAPLTACAAGISLSGAGQTITDIAGKSLAEVEAVLAGDSEPCNRLLAAIELASRNDKSAIGALTQALSDGAPVVRLAAAQSLLELGDRGGIVTLKALLSNDNVYAATHAAAVLAGNGDYSGVEMARSHLGHVSSIVREYSVQAVGQCTNDDLAYSALQNGVKDSDRSVRYCAIRLLGDRQKSRSIELLAPLASSTEPLVRFMALRSIAKTRLWDAIPCLLAALSSLDAGTRIIAVESLNQLTGRNTPTAPFAVSSEQDKMPALVQEWWAWWEANKQNHVPGEKLDASSPASPTSTEAGMRL